MDTLIKRFFTYHFKLVSLFKKGVLFLYNLAKPKSKSEDSKRHEFIFNIISLSSIIFLLLFSLIVAYWTIVDETYRERGANLEMFLTMLALFVFLHLLSRKGYFKISSYILLGVYFLPVTYALYTWGINMPQGILMYSLLILMSGILISTRFSFVATIIISITLIILAYLQNNLIILPELSWAQELPQLNDAFEFSITLFIIAIIAWLSNREIEKSLKRARQSEADLKKERDLLEVRVEERTRKLKQAQEEKALNLYRLAEFGKLSSGLFHDLVNPLTSVSLKMAELKKETEFEPIASGIDKITNIVKAAQTQMREEKQSRVFSLSDEIEMILQMLDYKAGKENVKIVFHPPKIPIKAYGSNIKFYRIMGDLISNAIDSYHKTDKESRKVSINISHHKNAIIVTVKDRGCGIKKENLEKIFEPLFTTKDVKEGTGLGLYICKNIIEKDFKGSVSVKSEEGEGTTFTIKIPAKKYAKD